MKIRWKQVLAMVVLIFLFLIMAFTGDLLVKRERMNQKIEAQGKVNIVVFGDSIWDLVRDDTGITAQASKWLGRKAVITNCSISGATAAYKPAPKDNSTSLLAVVNTLMIQNGKQVSQLMETTIGSYGFTSSFDDSLSIPEDKAAAEEIITVPAEDVDIFVLAYGINDYFNGMKQDNRENPYDVMTYGGALRTAIVLLRAAYPNAKFVIMSPTYSQGYSYGKIIAESDTYSYGGGTIPDYVKEAKAVAGELDATFINNYKDLNISIHNGSKYLEDATHLTELGRKKYAENFACQIVDNCYE